MMKKLLCSSKEKIVLIIFLVLSLISTNSFAQNKYFTLKGKIISKNGKGIENATILLLPGRKGTTSDEEGNFEIQKVDAGTYNLKISHVSYASFHEKISYEEGIINRVIALKDTTEVLQDINILGRNSERKVSFLPKVKGTNIYAGKKNKVIHLNEENIDLAENNPRQIFAKVPGVSVWEMDGTGNQVSIATRGLNPHRSWEMNVRQNGNVINSDLFGYPESHYNPPAEAVQKIELIRGSGALQYGPQFGGMLNYVLKEADTTKKIGFETQQSTGSFGLFSSFNSIGGKVNKLTYYGYYNFRRSEGWRENSDYHFSAWHAGFNYAFSKKVNLGASLSHMEYVNHFAAGLTDSMFREDPRQSNRPRNYFNPTIYLPAIHLEIQASKNTLITASTSAIFGQRNSVQFITLPIYNDTINPVTNEYNPRQVDRDYYHSYSAEVRLRQDYNLLGNKSHLVTGVRYGNSKTYRRQKGEGTTGTDFDLSITNDYKVDLTFKTLNYAFFAENVFTLTKKLSVTPGFRFDYISTDLTGEITAFDTPAVPFDLQRQFPLFGIGAQYNLNAHINAYANFTQAYRPVLHSDILPSSPLDRTDSNLEDARGNNSEIGIRGTLKNVLQWDVNYFRLQYNDRIGTLIKNEGSETYFYKTNIGDMLNEGMEAYIEFHPFNLINNKSKYLNLSLFTSTAYNSAHYTKGSITSGEQNISIAGNSVENVPQWISRNGINYSYEGLSAGLQGSYVSKSCSDALNTLSSANGVNGVIPSYFLLDFNFTYKFNKKYNVKFSLNNLTDKKYFTRRATGYPGPGILPSDGRSFLISFGVKI